MKKFALEGSLKKHRDKSRIIATAKMEVFVAIVSSFQSLTNFIKNPNIDAMGVLNAPLEYYNEIYVGDQIKYSRTKVYSVSKKESISQVIN